MQLGTRKIIWQALAWQGEERFEIIFDESFIRASGNLAGETEEGEVYALAYTIILSPEWRIETATIQNDRTGKNLQLTHQKNHWFDGAGKHLAEFDGLEYIDISLTPFTNTLPIKCEDFTSEPGRHKVSTIYIDLPSFDLYATNQFYTKLGPFTFAYEDEETPDFNAAIQVDEDGLVTDYQCLFEGTVVGDD
ncbi:MAG TPA: putative glycolipid-binding domain-containing protein [Candidatus Saccharimonadales bacterium]|nr:putative glycolipid-binding domain-containing protein [Candidatus Saccharimonadales bacterium]